MSLNILRAGPFLVRLSWRFGAQLHRAIRFPPGKLFVANELRLCRPDLTNRIATNDVAEDLPLGLFIGQIHNIFESC